LQANIGDEVYLEMIDAIKAKDPTKFKKSSDKFQQLILQQDSLLSSSKYFSLNTWLKQALSFGNTAQDKANAIKNAKIQITYWGPDYNAATDLHEYAHKEWSGLLGSLYLSRWKKFTEQELAKMSDPEAPITNYFKMDKAWTEDQEMYAPQQLSDKQLNDLISRIIK
jgi:alpha-N-acetylglucosaminidase